MTITVGVGTFSGSGGPTVAELAYKATAGASGETPGSAAAGTVTSSGNPVVALATAGKSASGGNNGSVLWTMVDNPQWAIGTYTAVATFTISGT